MLKTFIIDDEIKAIDLLRKYISQIDFLEYAHSSTNPMNAYNYLQANDVDVIFLDINMPILNGIELYQALVNKPKLILTTADPNYAVQGFELDAIDYLVKPITFTRFLKACEKLHRDKNLREESNLSSQKMISDILYVKSGTSTHKMSWKEILYLMKDENYVIYYTADDKVLCRETLSNLERLFPFYFIRVHKSYAVSLLHANRIKSNKILINDKTIPVGRSYQASLNQRIKELSERRVGEW